MTGELQETVDKTATCSAITEKRPNRLGGCVGVFFQLFDWNRRFAKKKLFSRKSLLPGKQASKRFGRDEKVLKSKLNLIDDENRGSFPNRGFEVVEIKKHEMRPPSLVARLMGLDSLPSTHRDKGKKKKPSHQIQDNNKCGLFGEEEEGEDNGIDKSRPQKMQRTTTGAVCDRRGAMVKKFGSEALQIKNVLTRVRKQQKYNSHHQHQKLASPVRSPRLQNRRSNSRLIDAAARILEPGRRNAKYAIPYPGSSGVRRCNNVGKEPVVYNSNSVASCNACGSFVDVHGSSPVSEETGKSVSESTPFERSKRSVFWRNQEPSMPVSGEGRGFTDPMQKKALHPARYDFSGKHETVVQMARFPPVVAQPYTFQSKRGCSSSPVNAIKCIEKDFVAMNKASTSRNYHHHSKARFENSDLNLQRNKSYTKVEESCHRSSGLHTPARKRRLACVSGHGQGSSSSMGPVSRRSAGESSCACSRETKERKGVPRQMCERIPKTPLDAGTTVGLIHQKLKEFASQEEDEAIIGSALPNKPASSILHELLSSIAHEQTACQMKGKTEMWSSIGNANSDYTSPGSVLDASFSNESCFSNSFDNLPVPGQMRLPLEPIETDWDVIGNSTSSGNYQAVTRLISHVSNVLRCLSNSGLILTQQRFNNAREVILHTELLLGTTTQDNYIIGPELFDELMIYAARSDNLANLTGITGGFLVDAMIEHLEERNVSCGGLKPSPSADASVLIRGVLEEVPKWAALARIDMDEVIDNEMEKWMEVETHSLGVGSEIAYEILLCLVGELAMDLF